jgi:hypothetical protein
VFACSLTSTPMRLADHLSFLHNASSEAFRCLFSRADSSLNMLSVSSKAMWRCSWTGACDPHTYASTPPLFSRRAARSKHVAGSAAEWGEISRLEGELHRVEQAGEGDEDEHDFTQAEWWLWQISLSAGANTVVSLCMRHLRKFGQW